ncbi:MAG TPA: Fic family protein [Candidatus Babeliales bacterium]|nr:Fic family protein [Candidatus Babeliales bacterium]
MPPAPEDLLGCLAALENFFRDQQWPPLVQIALIHYQFEAIHPFLDGNGRVGRLLIALYLLERQILPAPVLYLSAFFEATRPEYYARLLAVSRQNDWAGWLQYFLNGVARQAEDAASRAYRINLLLDQWRQTAAGLSTTVPQRLITCLAANPFLTIKQTAAQLELTYATVQRAVARLVALDILQEVGDNRRNRVYCAKQILAILEEPARILAS